MRRAVWPDGRVSDAEAGILFDAPRGTGPCGAAGRDGGHPGRRAGLDRKVDADNARDPCEEAPLAFIAEEKNG